VAGGTGEPGTPASLPGSLLPGRRRWRWVVAGVVVGAAAASTVVIVVWPFGGRSSAGSGGVGLYQIATGTVTRGTLTSRIAVDATLGDAGSYNVVNRVEGTYTAVPSVGQVLRQGQVLYQVNQSPVVLLYGPVPAYRDLSEGTTGADVRQLNGDLVALGYAAAAELDPSSDYFGAETAHAVEQWQAQLGVSQTGSVSLGQVVFLPSAIRVTAVQGFAGAPAGPGSLALTASSTIPQVTIDLDAAEQSYVRAGDGVTITLPDLQTTPGVVTSVGTVASAAAPGSGSPGATIPVQVRMVDPAAAGGLDQAPVQVSITTASVPDALAVPVTALLATTSGGYQVEVAGPGGRDRFVPVRLGLFDDAAGLVQVTGRGLGAGQRVVEAQT
jgi:peptidoglycan hydrolase-like protein with peptidoglycan-binding domain